MKKNSAVTCATLILVLLVWASALVGADSKARTAGVKSAETKAVEQKVPEVTSTVPPYKYNPIGKADPFKSFVEEESAREARKRQEQMMREARFFSPLQRAGIDQFRLVGIAGDEKARKAIVQDIKGKIYPIFIGTYIGPNNGRVIEILADRVIVEEKFKTQAGKTKVNRITMKLRKEEGEEKP
jgi:type IV pilus assembly protein PilP